MNRYLTTHLDCRLNGKGEDAIPLLVGVLDHSDPVISRSADRNLVQDSGPADRDALVGVVPEVTDAVVPPLVENLDTFLESGFPGDDISNMAEVITGQDLARVPNPH